MKKNILFAFALLFSLVANAQINGIIVGSDNGKMEPLLNAKAFLLHAKTGALSHEDGRFELILPRQLPDTLVFSYPGYFSDTLVVTKEDRFSNLKVVLFSDQTLPEFIVEYRKEAKSISKLKVLAVEEISLGELRKAACCNLSESFETNVSVDVNFTDAVSGAKQIQMMGLEGVYTQIQFENIPYLRGLEQPFGLSSFPGTWINSIQITKGTGTVVNGYESMAGLVNIEMFKPQDMDRFFINGYGGVYGRGELNLHGGMHVGKKEKWSTALFAHGSGVFVENNYNKDNFMDMPMGYLAAFNNRWSYQGKKMEAQIGVNSYLESKYGGEVGYKRGSNKGLFGMETDAKHLDVYAKTGFFMKKPYNSIGIIYNLKYQENDALFGLRRFSGTEKRGYINGMFEGIIGTTIHKYKVGLSGVFADFKQRMDTLTDNRLEIVPGAFFEYTYSIPRFTLVVGARGDYHNLYKFQFAPRMHAKFAITEYTDLRVTAGKGWRVPNYMIDNISLLATSHRWVAPTETLPEISWNFGGSLVQSFKLFGNPASMVVDYYHTLFERQLIVDRDEDMTAIVFKNIKGKSFSNSVQVEFSFQPAKRFDIRLAYKFLDVRAEYGGKLQQKVMVPKHRGFINLFYTTRNKKWEFNLTTSVFGTSRLPVNQLDSLNFTTDNKSKVYPQLSAQVTYRHKRWDFYIGGENLTNYRQKNPIIDADNPFGTYFDATRIWAPITGVNVYVGFRFVIEHKEHED